MKHLAIFTALLVFLGSASAEIKFRIMLGPKVAGYARIDQKLTPDGGKFVQLIMRLKKNGENVVVRSETTLNADGTPLRLIQDITPDGKAPVMQKIATFDSHGASVVVKDHGAPKVVHVPYDTNGEPGNEAEFWFLRDRPSIGAECRACVFDIDSMTWVTSVSTYQGDASGGHRLVVDRDGRTVDTLVDDAGIPISLDDSAGFSFIRLPN